jgi:hypothetical protein
VKINWQSIVLKIMAAALRINVYLVKIQIGSLIWKKSKLGIQNSLLIAALPLTLDQLNKNCDTINDTNFIYAMQ